MPQPIVAWTSADYACRKDPRSLADQLAGIAELGAIAPEALHLSEIRMLCSAFLAGRADGAALASGEAEARLSA